MAVFECYVYERSCDICVKMRSAKKEFKYDESMTVIANPSNRKSLIGNSFFV